MYRRQRGITLIGWVILLAPLAVVVYCGIRLAPIYLNYMRVAHSIDTTSHELKQDDGMTLTAELIRGELAKHFDIESITFPATKDVTITRDGTGWTMEAKFEDNVPLFGNISLVIDFDKVGKIG